MSLFSDFDFITGLIFGFLMKNFNISEESEEEHLEIAFVADGDKFAKIRLDIFPNPNCTGAIKGKAIAIVVYS